MTLFDVFYAQQLMAWAVVFIAILTFIAVVLGVWVAFLVRSMDREIAESRKRSEQSFERAEQSFERLGYYLFGKLGPADIK